MYISTSGIARYTSDHKNHFALTLKPTHWKSTIPQSKKRQPNLQGREINGSMPLSLLKTSMVVLKALLLTKIMQVKLSLLTAAARLFMRLIVRPEGMFRLF